VPFRGLSQQPGRSTGHSRQVLAAAAAICISVCEHANVVCFSLRQAGYGSAGINKQRWLPAAVQYILQLQPNTYHLSLPWTAPAAKRKERKKESVPAPVGRHAWGGRWWRPLRERLREAWVEEAPCGSSTLPQQWLHQACTADTRSYKQPTLRQFSTCMNCAYEHNALTISRLHKSCRVGATRSLPGK
jgi:hypothetical protein